MNQGSSSASVGTCRPVGGLTGWKRFFPALEWIKGYRRNDLYSDILAGVVVAVLLVPQGMAYALLAGLPPQVGLYASLLPVLVYPLFGTSRFLAVGPVAMVSLLVASTIESFPGNQISPLILAAALALLAGIMQLAMGLLRMGLLVNFLSHSVISGFTTAAAIIIGLSQLKHLLGIQLVQTERLHELAAETVPRLGATNGVTLLIGTTAALLLFVLSSRLRQQLAAWKVPESFREPLSKSGPLLIIALATVVAWWFNLPQRFGLKVVGNIPAGLPDLSVPWPGLGAVTHLIPEALVIVFIGFMESVSVAKSLAAKRRQKIEPNQELIALGMTNLAAGFTGGYPVTGGFSRSVVNFNAGAKTAVSSAVAAVLIGATLLFLTPLFHYLPQTVLAAVILVAVSGLLDFRVVKMLWRYDRSDASAWIFTFLSVLFLGIETGILVGVGTTIVLFLWRTSRPHMAVVGKIPGSETYRNVTRHETEAHPGMLLVRIDGSLYFANTRHFQDQILCWMSDKRDLRQVVLICSAVNYIDSSALETLATLLAALRDQQVDFFLAEVKGPVMDRLRRSNFLEELGEEHVFITVEQAVKALSALPPFNRGAPMVPTNLMH